MVLSTTIVNVAADTRQVKVEDEHPDRGAGADQVSPRSPGMRRMVARGTDIGGAGNTAGYHPVAREFSLTESSAPGTRRCLGADCLSTPVRGWVDAK